MAYLPEIFDGIAFSDRGRCGPASGTKAMLFAAAFQMHVIV
jgi:hypothetical protein